MRRLLYILPVLFLSCMNERAGFDDDFRNCIAQYDYSDRVASYEFSEAINPLLVGKSVPDWKFTDLNGKDISLHAVTIPVIIVNFNNNRGEGIAFVATLNRWFETHTDSLLVIVNCMVDAERIEIMSRWSTNIELALKNPSLHFVAGDLEKDGSFFYVNGVNDDDGVCSIYYIDKDHKVAHYDPYGALMAWRNDVLYTNDPPETDYDAACDTFMSERIEKYLLSN